MIIFLGNQSGSNANSGPAIGGGASASITVFTGNQLSNYRVQEDFTYTDLGYNWRIDFVISGLGANDIADINFQPDIAVSGLVSPFAESYAGKVSAWLKTDTVINTLDLSKTSVIVNNI